MEEQEREKQTLITEVGEKLRKIWLWDIHQGQISSWLSECYQ